MARRKPVLATAVPLRLPNGQAIIVGPGPLEDSTDVLGYTGAQAAKFVEWAREEISNPAAWVDADDLEEPTEPPPDVPVPPDAPGKNASTADWLAYARDPRVAVEVGDDATRTEIQDACRAAGKLPSE